MVPLAFIIDVNRVTGTRVLYGHPRTLNLDHSISMKAVSNDVGMSSLKIKRGSRFKDLTGKKFGFVTVLSLAGKLKSTKEYSWLCECTCGRHVLKTSGTLGYNKKVSCGCVALRIRRETHQTHAKSGSAEYACWCGMKRRCLVPSVQKFKNYGGRGIKVCERWMNSFENFYADMGPRPSRRHSIERIDNNGHYHPDNCRWATQKEQTRNTCRTHYVTINNQTKCISDWAKIVGIEESSFRERVSKKWSGDKLLTPKMK